jgi:hypothetical protein
LQELQIKRLSVHTATTASFTHVFIDVPMTDIITKANMDGVGFPHEDGEGETFSRRCMVAIFALDYVDRDIIHQV